VLAIDGQPVPIRAVGTEGQLLSGKDLPVATCHGAPITLEPGDHTLLAGGGLQPDTVELSTGAAAPPATTPTLPQMSWTQRWGGGYDITVKNAAGPYYLVIGQNYDPRWEASIGGTGLGPPIVLDGYSLGWRVSRAGTYTISVRYGKQRLYDGALLLSGLTLAFGLAAIVVGWRRRRRAAASAA
jgi:arabinofuranan 3-O-arabinosyltransferase